MDIMEILVTLASACDVQSVGNVLQLCSKVLYLVVLGPKQVGEPPSSSDSVDSAPRTPNTMFDFPSPPLDHLQEEEGELDRYVFALEQAFLANNFSFGGERICSEENLVGLWYPWGSVPNPQSLWIPKSAGARIHWGRGGRVGHHSCSVAVLDYCMRFVSDWLAASIAVLETEFLSLPD